MGLRRHDNNVVPWTGSWNRKRLVEKLEKFKCSWEFSYGNAPMSVSYFDKGNKAIGDINNK